MAIYVFGHGKVGCVLTMFSWSEFRMKNYRDDESGRRTPLYIHKIISLPRKWNSFFIFIILI